MPKGAFNLETVQKKRLWLGISIVGGVFLFVGLLYMGLSEWASNATSSTTTETPTKENQSATKLPSVKVIKPQREDMAYTITLPANVSPMYRATLYTKVSGYVKWMGFDKGDPVKKGEMLAIINAPEIAEEYKQAEAEFQIKKVTYERLNAVWKENSDVIAKQDVDVARAAAEAAKNLRDTRQTLLQYTKVYAPFSGTITARYTDPGALVQAATGSSSQAFPLYTIMDFSTVRVYASVPQEEALLAKPGVPATLVSMDMAGKEWKATITRTTKALDPATRTLLVEIDVPNKDGELQPGAFLNTTLHLGQKKHVLKIPAQSVIAHGSQASPTVFIVRQGKVHQVPVKVGAKEGAWVEILEGLNGGEEVVVEGKGPLIDEQAVTTTPYTVSP